MRGNDANIDLDLSDVGFNASGDFIRALNANSFDLTLDADNTYISADRAINVTGNQASLDITFANNDMDLGSEMIQVSGQDALINLSLTNVDIDAADGINLTSTQVTEGHELSIELNDVSMDLNTGEFLSIREGVGLVLDITANDVQISADSFVNISDASGAQINVNMTEVTVFGEFGDNMFNIEGADSSTDVNISLTNFGDGGFADLGSSDFFEENFFVNPENAFVASGDILNITGDSSEFNLSITGLTPVGAGYGPFLVGGVNGHGDIVDLSGNNNQGTITLGDSIFILDDYTGIDSFEDFVLSSKTGILEMTGDANSIDISVHDTNFLAISADYTNSTMIDVVGDGNRINVDFTDVVMHTMVGESWEYFGEDINNPNYDIPPYQLFMMGEDRLNLLNMNGDSSDFTLETHESIFNTRVEMHGDSVNYTHNDHGAESEFNSVHMYMDVGSSDISISLDGSFSDLDDTIGHEGIAYGGVVVGNSNTINFNLDSQHLSLRTYGYSDDVNFNLSNNESVDMFDVLGSEFEAGLLISSDMASTSTINFNLDDGSHLDGYLDLLAADVGSDSLDIVNYDVNLRVDSNSTVDFYLTTFSEDVVVNLELDNLNNNLITRFFDFSGDVDTLIHLDTSYGAEVNISMADDGNENFYFNHSGIQGYVNLVAENFNNRDNFDAIDLDWNSSMEYTNFNSEYDTLVVGNNSVDIELDVSSGSLSGISSSANESTDLVLFADGASADSLITAITNSSLDSWYDDVYLVFGEDSVDGDVFIYRWSGADDGQLVATLIDAYDEIFDSNILANQEDIISTQLYEHRYEYTGLVI
jgi:hypothetical protein